MDTSSAQREYNSPAYGGGSEVAPQLIVLRMSHQYMINYSYLVVDPGSSRAVMVDPAWQMEKIDQALADTRAVLSGILITHAHCDHTHLARPLAAKHRCPIWMSREEIAASGFADERLRAIEATWAVGSMLIEPLFTPGHTSGGVCYLIGDNAFVGDTLFVEGCGLCPDTRAAYELYASLEYLKTRLGQDTRIFPGHVYSKPLGLTFSRVLKENIYLHFKNKVDFAAYRLRSGQNTAKMLTFS